MAYFDAYGKNRTSGRQEAQGVRDRKHTWNPSQAIKDRHWPEGPGVIDTIHWVEVAGVIETIQGSPADLSGIKE
jgi:hypothetical protein